MKQLKPNQTQMQWPQAHVININQMPSFTPLKSNKGAEHEINKENGLGAAKVSLICRTMSTFIAATNQETPFPENYDWTFPKLPSNGLDIWQNKYAAWSSFCCNFEMQS